MKHNKSPIGIREALYGLFYTLRTQTNFKIQLVLALVMVNAGLYFQIQIFEWLVLILTIGLVLVTEVLNTAVEASIDLIVSDFNPIAKIVKDTAAGAVFVASVISVIIGLIIFLPFINQLLGR